MRSKKVVSEQIRSHSWVHQTHCSMHYEFRLFKHDFNSLCQLQKAFLMRAILWNFLLVFHRLVQALSWSFFNMLIWLFSIMLILRSCGKWGFRSLGNLQKHCSWRLWYSSILIWAVSWHWRATIPGIIALVFHTVGRFVIVFNDRLLHSSWNAAHFCCTDVCMVLGGERRL